ncbi:MAG: EF-P lysine aminoacylase EpmA [Lysobacteraceae bacterium]
MRAELYRLIREFFAQRDVLEVETPILSRAGTTDPNIASFSLDASLVLQSPASTSPTDRATSDLRWLRTSPEFALKRLLASGVGDCYEMGRVFRRGEAGRNHNPEFTMLEWYRLGWDHRRLMREVTELVFAVSAALGRTVRPSEISYRALYVQTLGVDPFTASIDEFKAALGSQLLDDSGLCRDDWLDLLMTHRIQPQLAADGLLLVYDYPASQCALARIREPDISTAQNQEPFAVAERFEVYLGSLELANGYHELTDATEQRSRFERDLDVRRARGEVSPPIDEALLQAMQHGLPRCAGVALGLDRLLMSLLDHDRIAESLAFDWKRS